MQTWKEEKPNRPVWRCTNTRIVGNYARQKFKELGEEPSLIAQDDIVRTPSDHIGILAELIYSDSLFTAEHE